MPSLSFSWLVQCSFPSPRRKHQIYSVLNTYFIIIKLQKPSHTERCSLPVIYFKVCIQLSFLIVFQISYPGERVELNCSVLSKVCHTDTCWYANLCLVFAHSPWEAKDVVSSCKNVTRWNLRDLHHETIGQGFDSSVFSRRVDLHYPF